MSFHFLYRLRFGRLNRLRFDLRSGYSGHLDYPDYSGHLDCSGRPDCSDHPGYSGHPGCSGRPDCSDRPDYSGHPD